MVMTAETAHPMPPPEGEALGAATFLEADFPFQQISRLAQRDRNSRDAIYRAHKWWARRPPAVIRALLIAAQLPATTPRETFWTSFASSDLLLDGVHVGDPFMGGA
ncbi:MAG TPA: DUF1156 domain-containing protein, partial [Candidatus Limnocylindria bacterium]|nr:DUF1156 domain-containing protein [Candidatus Limnocylindria bacterium]